MREYEGERLITAINLTNKIKNAPVSGEALISNYEKSYIYGKLYPYEAAIIRG